MAVYVLALAILLLIALHSLFKRAQNSVNTVSHIPGMKVLFAPISLPGSLLPTSLLNPGLSWQWAWRGKIYETYQSETISVTPYLVGTPMVYTTSMEVARQILSTRDSRLEKSSEATSGVVEYGANLFSANGNDWRKHRRIMGPAFTQETYQSVWRESASIYREMLSSEGWADATSVDLPAINPYMTRFALVLLSRCGFGAQMMWRSSEVSTDIMHIFGNALETVSETFVHRLVIPKWAYSLPIQSIRRVDEAYQTLTTHIHRVIHEQENMSEAENNILSRLIAASKNEGKLALTADEITGNLFFVLFAGHETMSSIWTATFALLALHKDIQDEMYSEVCKVASGDSPLLYVDFAKLNKILACFIEAARLYPAGFVLLRDATEDLTLQTPTVDQQPGKPLFIRKGTRLAVDMVGMHYNPRHFPEPEEYRPSRWYDTAEEDLSIFSVGSRACIGRKFAMTEACCFLAHLIRDWEIRPLLNDGENITQWGNRVMKARVTMTLGVGTVPVRLVKRA